MSDIVVERGLYPAKHLTARKVRDDIVRQFGYITLLNADLIFEIVNGVTRYHKDRYYTEYQYTPEDEVVLKLRSVLI